jgi:predicted O-methyltransferase YrrM
MENVMEFTNQWFPGVVPVWDQLLDFYKPKSYLEIGVYEGQSLLYVAEWMEDNGGGYCIGVDPYYPDELERVVPGTERVLPPVNEVYDRAVSNIDEFHDNSTTATSVQLIDRSSKEELPRLLEADMRFDMIYVDGSHHASDVLFDMVVGWELLKPGGVMICDDYLWRSAPIGHPNYRLLHHPKLAIDAFVNVNYDKLWVIESTNRQVYLVKLKENANEKNPLDRGDSDGSDADSAVRDSEGADSAACDVHVDGTDDG